MQPATTFTPFLDRRRHTAVPIPPMPPLTKAMRRSTGAPASREASAPGRAIVAAVAVVMVRLPLNKVRHAPRGRDVTAGGLCHAMLDVAPGRGLDRFVLGIAQARARLHALTAEALEPRAPDGLPASRCFRFGGEPRLRAAGQLPARPLAALPFRGGIDDPGDVAARPEHETHVALEQLRRAVRRAPGHDVVLARREHIGG